MESMNKLVTFEDLRAALIESAIQAGIVVPPMIGIPTNDDQIWEPTDENVLWFVALLKAQTTREDSLKDLAQMFLRGVDPVTKETIPGWLAQLYEGDDPKEWSDLRGDMDYFFHS